MPHAVSWFWWPWYHQPPKVQLDGGKEPTTTSYWGYVSSSVKCGWSCGCCVLYTNLQIYTSSHLVRIFGLCMHFQKWAWIWVRVRVGARRLASLAMVRVISSSILVSVARSAKSLRNFKRLYQKNSQSIKQSLFLTTHFVYLLLCSLLCASCLYLV